LTFDDDQIGEIMSEEQTKKDILYYCKPAIDENGCIRFWGVSDYTNITVGDYVHCSFSKDTEGEETFFCEFSEPALIETFRDATARLLIDGLISGPMEIPIYMDKYTWKDPEYVIFVSAHRDAMPSVVRWCSLYDPDSTYYLEDDRYPDFDDDLDYNKDCDLEEDIPLTFSTHIFSATKIDAAVASLLVDEITERLDQLAHDYWLDFYFPLDEMARYITDFDRVVFVAEMSDDYKCTLSEIKAAKKKYPRAEEYRGNMNAFGYTRKICGDIGICGEVIWSAENMPTIIVPR